MGDNQGFKERLISFINYLHISVRSFEIAVGLSNGAVKNIRNGISYDKVMKISEVYPQLNVSWLYSGDGEMLKDKVVCEEMKPYNTEERHTPYDTIKEVLAELKTLKQKIDVYESKIENYEKDRTQMLDNISQLTSIIKVLTKEREELANKNK